MSECIKLGDIPLDSAQTTRKAWCDSKDGHRVVPVNVEYNVVEYTYNADCTVNTIEYLYDDVAEKTTVTFPDDCGGNLCGKLLTFYSATDAKQYNVYYSVCCLYTPPCEVGVIHNVLVNIKACDVSPVVSLATYNALLSDCCAPCDVTLLLDVNDVAITNSTRGTATDASTTACCITLCIGTQGARTSTETLTYAYNACGIVTSVTSTSGENLVNVIEPSKHVTDQHPISVLDPNNSTSTPLAANATFTGCTTEVVGYSSVGIIVNSDTCSTDCGMQFQFSTDGTNWDEINKFTLDADVGVTSSTTRRFQFPVTARYYRFVYTNSIYAQTNFRVQTILHVTDILQSIHNVDADISLDRSVNVVKSVIAAKHVHDTCIHSPTDDSYVSLEASERSELLTYTRANVEQMVEVKALLSGIDESIRLLILQIAEIFDVEPPDTDLKD